MLEASRIELHRIVLEAIDKYGEDRVVEVVNDIDLWGHVDETIVTVHNMHLFRQFRNAYGGSKYLIAMAKGEPNWDERARQMSK